MRYVQRYDRKKQVASGRVHRLGCDPRAAHLNTLCGLVWPRGEVAVYIGGAADIPRMLHGDCAQCAKAVAR